MKSRTEYMRNYRQRTKKKCATCTAMVLKKSHQCKACAGKIINDTRTLQDVLYTKHHKSSAFALVRSGARYRCPESPCVNCGYALHTEVCHIKPLSGFPLTATIEEVNAPENLIRLCPNCHWEFDKGRLVL